MFNLQGIDPESVSDLTQKVEQAYDQLLKNPTSGFYDLVHRQELWQLTQKRADELRSLADHMVVIGIGGSSLGARAIKSALSSKTDRRLDFLDNVDGWELEEFLQGLENLSKVHWVFISKSGSTLETLSLANYIHQFVEGQGLSLSAFTTVVSEEKDSPLVAWAKKNEIPCLPVPLDVGGRFSVLTPVGMLPAAFIGLDIEGFRLGAEQVLKNPDSVKKLTAFSLRSFQQQRWITAFWFYSTRMFEFGRWIQQLWAESLAKKVDRQGGVGPQSSVPLPLLGSTDQHSVLQQLAEGIEKKSVWFFRVAESERHGPKLSAGPFTDQTSQLLGKPIGALLAAFSQSTRESLMRMGSETLEIELMTLDEEELGGLFMTLMLVVGALGECLDVDAFNQPGVELGKTLVKDFL